MRCVLIALAVMAGSASAQDGNACTGLAEVVDSALDTSPRITQASAEQEIARARVLAARSRNLPQFNLFGQAGLGDSQPIDVVRDDQVGVSAEWELFSFGQRSAAIAAAQETLRSARAGELQAQVEVAERAVLLYYELLRTERLVELTSAQTDGYAQEAETVERRLSRGLVTRSDARQIEARYASALARREEAMIRRDQVAIELSVFVGRDVGCVRSASARRLGDALRAILGGVTPARALVLAEDYAFILDQARARVRSAEASYRSVRRAGLPSLSLNAFVLGEYDDSDLPVEDRWNQEDRVGFSITQPLFAGGALKAERAEERARLRAAVAELETRRQELETEVRTAVLGVQRQGAIQARRSAAEAAARDRLDATSTELERGTKTITDFVLANEDYYTAAIDEVSAAWARDQELVRLAALTGILLEVDVPALAETPRAEVVLPE